MELDGFLTGLAVGGALCWLALKRRGDNDPPNQPESYPTGAPAVIEPDPLSFDIFAQAQALEPRFEASAHPSDLLPDSDFQRAVATLTAESMSPQAVADYALGANWILAAIAFEALAQRADAAECAPAVRQQLGAIGPWPMFFALRYLRTLTGEPTIGPVIAAADEWWEKSPLHQQVIGGFIREQLDSGELASFGEALANHSAEQLHIVELFLDRVRQPGLEALDAELAAKRDSLVDTKFLAGLGRLREEPASERMLIEDARSMRVLAALRSHFEQRPPASMLLVGESGVGKSTARELLATWLLEQGWRVLETGAINLIAGKSYLGEIEEQVRKLISNTGVSKRVVLFIDRFHELASAGAHRLGPEGVLDHLLPSIERGEIVMVGETDPRHYLELLRRWPTLPTALQIVRIPPASQSESLALTESLLARLGAKPNADDVRRLARDALQLAQHYVAFKQLPGNAIDLVRLTVARKLDQTESALTLERADLIETLAQLTGLPVEVLDDRSQLDIDDIEQRFKARVIGQNEAVTCLVERVAMIKAGLTDATRPFGVFLFAGPTGTGKTEIAKTLATVLFGAPDRMIRLDMSEYQTAESMRRLLGQSDDGTTAQSLVDLIRKQPFSVVLLDEFEKAHANVWDVFLQVFDDGRLTDALGGVADFRHSIIIMTSNVGATIRPDAGIGFTSTGAAFAANEVRDALGRTFRKEFLNRIDRIVVFDPLTREQMRRILYKELNDVLDRRGFRNREWAVEWEDSAVEFLLERGFTPDLGARPLRRAIDQYVLAPLSMTIVREQFPQGDQFLFVRSDGERIQVEFVDPDAESDAQPNADQDPAGENPKSLTSLAQVVREPRASAEERAFLTAQFAALEDRIASPAWVKAKHTALARLADEHFWDAPDRYAVLGRAELMDRIEAAMRSLSSLVRRVSARSGASSLSSDVAEKLYLLNIACDDLNESRPLHAFLSITTRGDNETAELAQFFESVIEMYTRWAKRRRMKLQVLRRRAASNNGSLEILIAVSGFGAYSILAPESGLHVLEVPSGDGKFTRHTLRVVVMPQPERPERSKQQLLEEATKAVNGEAENASDMVRRYRETPSPLVRDSVRGWRTGRLDRVFDGDFDVM
jgi:ATP-dependent Clp protease ATP-binding subunit ClpC